ncbi:MAG TPA: GNAT family protein [Solirubrobacteraceae bacterium]|nr:GNAT family protein [Solirubrobacteraceae bacterium]
MSFQLPGGYRLRVLEDSDAEELYELIDANRRRLARWMAWAEPQTREQTLEFIRGTHRQLADNDGFQTAIVDPVRIVGMVGFHAVDWQHRSTSIGYWLAQGEEGSGTMTQAVSALVDHAFGEWRLNRVEIRVDVENVRSRALAERLGFQQEGTLRQAMRLDGGYHDDALYAMLAQDWPVAGPTRG